MLEINKPRGVPFKLTIPADAPLESSYILETQKKVCDWAKERWLRHQKTIKQCFFSKIREFNDGKGPDEVLLIDGHLYDMSDTDAEETLNDLVTFLNTGISPQYEDWKKAEKRNPRNTFVRDTETE